MEPNSQLVFHTPVIDFIRNLRFITEALLVLHYIKQKGAYGVVYILEDFISYQQVLKYHVMLKLRGEGFSRFVPIIGHPNQ